jgi:enoyl-CoA hydratase/carnithine racemase
MPQVHVERSGRVMTVTLDNPPRNLMTGRMVGELDQLTRELEGDRSIGAVVLTGAADGVFITHFDVDEIVRGSGATPQVSSRQAGASLRAVGAMARIPGVRGAMGRTPAAGLLALQQIHELFLRMNRLDKTFIAAINGVAMGGGCELTLACDVRIMADGDGRIGLPEVTVGILAGGGGTQRLTRALGPSRALEMMLEGRLLTPREAEAVGMVHRVVPPDRLLYEARDTAERLARRSPIAVGAIKRAVYEGGSRPLGEGLHIEQAGFMAAASSPAAIRAMETYVREDQSRADTAPAELPHLFDRWREGTAVDMTDGG